MKPGRRKAELGRPSVRQGFVVPVYNHGRPAADLAEKLLPFGLPLIFVDDGSGPETKAFLSGLVEKPGVFLVTLKKNRGKGEAVLRGVEKAAELGLSHVLQIDADGQHDSDRAGFFLEESARRPGSVICGFPVFDQTAPKERVIGRKIANFWAGVVTLSGALKDVMCGFRVYPVEPFLKNAGKFLVDKRMGFDVEIMVRLYWSGVFPEYFPVTVRYPPGGISNFHLLRDNLRITWVITRLFFGMLFRIPSLAGFHKKGSGR
ncbi:MAG: glycosyltransferase family 2 protein [Treponema sp.]|jgi:glycosyltransferase involved in cell wall biosynthesis|nr:glycosyltransferase family 2 protein [Treponema sp.]